MKFITVKKVKRLGTRSAGEKPRESKQLLESLTERSRAGIYVVKEGKFQTTNMNAAAHAG